MVSVLAHVPRLPFSLDPLIAEARRRARQRRVLLAAVVIVVAGGAATGGILASSSSYVATRPLQVALARSPLGGGSTGPAFAPRATFAVGLVLTNKAGAAVTLQDARAVLASPAPLRQIGTLLTPFTLVQCPGGCPPGYPRYVTPPYPPYGAIRPVPLTVAPGHQALIQLNFRFVACWDKPLPWRPVTRQLIVGYRTPAGTVIHQRLALVSISVTGMNTSRCHR